MVQLPYADRDEAGRLLGAELVSRELPENTIVLALPRGGVPVGLAVANTLRVPLDVVVVRKLGVPWQPELAMGAVTSGAVQVLDADLIRELRIPQKEIDVIVERERSEAARRERLYRGGRQAPDLQGRTVLLVDDGLATGSTMVVAARYARSLKPSRLIVAAPVASTQACRWLETETDGCICLATPELFVAVGQWYVNFRQVSDAEVQGMLEQSRRHAQGRIQARPSC